MQSPFILLFVDFLRRYRYEFILVGIILLVFWPFTFGFFIPKWDNLDAYFPYRHAIGEIILSGNWPLWHPYMHLGNAAYADLQAGAWSPVVWLLTLVGGGYGIHSLIIELLLCYVVAGIGMFRLLRSMCLSPRIAFLFALTFALSGFMVGSSQLMVFLWGLAWLPWCLLWLKNLLTTHQLRFALALAACFSLNLTTASPSFSIVLTYFLSIFTVLFWIRQRRSNYNYLRSIGLLLFSALGVILLSLPYLNAFYEFAPYFNRLAGLSLERILENPFTPRAYLTYVLPYISIANSEFFFGTDLSLRSGYLGIAGFFGALLGFVAVRFSGRWWLMVAVIVSLILAAGELTGVYHLLYHLPGFDTFRHPSLFRGYTIFFMLMAAALTLQRLSDREQLQKWVIRGSVALTIVTTTALIFLLCQAPLNEISGTLDNLLALQEFPEFGTHAHATINLLILFFALGISALARLFTKLNSIQLIILFTTTELALIAWVMAPTTVFITTAQEEVSAFMQQLPDAPAQQFNETPLNELTHDQGFVAPPGVWQNLSVFYKQPAQNGYNPLQFKSYESLSKSGKLAYIIANPIVYSPQKQLLSIDEYAQGNEKEPGLLWGVNDAPTAVVGQLQLDSTKIGYNRFEAFVQNQIPEKSWLVLNQNYHHQWKAHCNSEELNVFRVNDGVMGVQIPPEVKGTLVWKYQSPRTTYAAIIALLCWIVTTGFFVRRRTKSEDDRTCRASESNPQTN